MNERPIKVTKKADKSPPKIDDYLFRHDHLLGALIERNFERAKEIIKKIAASNRANAA